MTLIVAKLKTLIIIMNQTLIQIMKDHSSQEVEIDFQLGKDQFVELDNKI